MIYAASGLLLSIGVATAAWIRSRRRGGFYDRETYGMDASAHLRYCGLSLAFAAFFAISWALHLEPAGIAGLALYALIAVFYGASFLRGASDAD